MLVLWQRWGNPQELIQKESTTNGRHTGTHRHQQLQVTFVLLEEGLQCLDVIFADAETLLVQLQHSAQLDDATQLF